MAHLSMWTIYYDTKDYPELYVTREFKITAEGPIASEACALSSDLEHARKQVPEGCVRIERSLDDDPVIVESWI